MWPAYFKQEHENATGHTIHYHRFLLVPKTSSYDEDRKLQAWQERCKCGDYNIVYSLFDKSGKCITPQSKKYWFNQLGELERVTGKLELSANYRDIAV